MDNLLPPLVVILVALLGARVSFSSAPRGPGPALLFGTGVHFLLVGFALGPSVIGLLTLETTQSLFPFLALGLGWVGFHFGLQLEWEALARFPLRHYVLALGQAIGTFALFLIGGAALTRLAGLEGDMVPILLLGAACTAAVTTPAAVAVVSGTFFAKGPIRDLLFFVSSIDGVVGLLALQVTYSLYRPDSALTLTDAFGLPWIAAAVGLGLVLGILFLWLARGRTEGDELVLYVLGICAFGAGAALQWGLSPLFVCMIMGAVVANLGPSRARVALLLTRWEKMVYVTFLLVAGALLQFPTWVVVPAAAGYFVLRLVAKVVSTRIFVIVTDRTHDVRRDLGWGLIPQGGIAIAMAASGVLVYPELTVAGYDAEAVLFSTIVIGVVLAELLGPSLMTRLLTRAGEIDPAIVEALAGGDQDGARQLALERAGGTRPAVETET